MAADGKIALLKELQQYAEEKDPNFAIVSELICDVFLQYLDFTHGYETQNTSYYEFPEWLQVRSEIYRYTFPTHRMTCRFCENENEFNLAFVNGLLFEHHLEGPSGGGVLSSTVSELEAHVYAPVSYTHLLEISFFSSKKFSIACWTIHKKRTVKKSTS